ncbi:MAG: polysaccharide deacetylase family protein [Bacteroidota bacterium]
MITYFVHTPAWLRGIFPKDLIWNMPEDDERSVYITFDDGPHPTATPYAMEQLARHDAKATFFCVGNNVAKHPDIYDQLLSDGHATGNHTHDHVNGMKTETTEYMANIAQAGEYIHNRIFRPPYGRIKASQVRALREHDPAWKIYMWDVLSADFDNTISPQQCLDNVLKHIKPGAIVIFHDSEKAWDRMSYALPQVLAYCQSQNWKMKALPY